MQRESLFGERIIWMGGPKIVKTPPMFKSVAHLLFVFAAISTCYAFVIGLGLKVPPTESLLFAVWSVTLGLAALQLPQIWLSKAQYIITDNHVIWRRGPFHRSIERRSISYARIYWDPKAPGVGDLELVRAVPTGALRRRLMLRLNLVAAPDRVWAIVRGAEDVAPRGDGDQPLTQRLDSGERVVWSARPHTRWRAYLPHGHREWSLLAMAFGLLAVSATIAWRGAHALGRVLESGLPALSFAFVGLVFGLVMSVLLVLTVAGALLYSASIRPAYLVKHTRYLVTDSRVLIQRGTEELHLDRGKIVEVIDTPTGEGLSNVFIVLDGPRARALAASGAFGEINRGPNLRPVFESVQDAESLSRILLGAGDLRRAA